MEYIFQCILLQTSLVSEINQLKYKLVLYVCMYSLLIYVGTYVHVFME